MMPYSTPEGHRSMLANIFEKEKMWLPETFENEWEDYLQGNQNKIAENRAA